MKSFSKTLPRARTDSGQTLVEFAISAIIFFLLVFAIIDFSFLYFAKLTLQNAARQGGRYAMTGQSMSSHTRYESIMQTVVDHGLGFATSSNTKICSTTGGCGSGGGPGDTVTITITYPYKFITPLVAPFFTNGSYTITVSASFKNEPFPPNQT